MLMIKRLKQLRFLRNKVVLITGGSEGIGKALVQFCEATALSQGLGSVSLYTNAKMTANLAIYPRLGYVEVGRRSEAGFDRVYFEKNLLAASQRRSTTVSRVVQQDALCLRCCVIKDWKAYWQLSFGTSEVSNSALADSSVPTPIA